MKKPHLVLLPFLALLLAAALPSFGDIPMTVAVSPTNIAWDTNAWVDLVITNVPDTQTVYVTLFIDADSDMEIDAGDLALCTFQIKNGETNRFGALSMPADDDAHPTNNAVHTRVSFFGADSPLHGIGSYIWQARRPGQSWNGTNFSVSQPTSTVWVTGRVVDYLTTNPIPAALVQLLYFFDDGYEPAAWTDTNGLFRLYLPAHVSTANVEGVRTLGLGYFSAEYRDDTDEYISLYRFAADLHAGENALTNDLRLVPAATGLIYTISGHVYDEDTNGLPAALVEFEPEDGDDFSLALTDTNGYYELPAPEGMEGFVFCADFLLNMRGLVGAAAGDFTMTGDIPNVDIMCPEATVLARSLVTNAVTGDPVAGVGAEFYGDAYGGMGYSFDGGIYEIGLLTGTNYEGEVDGDSLNYLGFARANTYRGLAMTNEGVFADAPLSVDAGGRLSGHVYDRQTNALTGGHAVAQPYAQEGGDGGDGTDVDRHGYYELLVGTGTYRVAAEAFRYYLPQNYSNHYFWEWSNGPVADPVEVTTAGVSGIDFYLEQGGLITGMVTNEAGDPLDDVWVSVYEVTPVRMDRGRLDFYWRGNDETENGLYEITSPAGTNLRVGAEGEGWLQKYYDGLYAYQRHLAGTVGVTAAQTTSNINFMMEAPSYIEGAVLSGGNPVSGMWVMVDYALDTSDWLSVSAGDTSTAGDGTYTLEVPPGSNAVVGVDPDEDSYYIRQFWSNAPADWVATLIDVGQDVTISNIDFDLVEGMRIEGRVTDETGVPLSEFWVDAEYFGTNEGWYHAATDLTDGNGDYGLIVPATTDYFVRVPHQDGTWYPETFYSNRFSGDLADLVGTNAGETVAGVDFRLNPGYLVNGFVYYADAATIVSDSYVAAMDETNNWYGGDPADDGGWYELFLPTNRALYLFGSGPDCVPEYYDNVYPATQATPVLAGALTTVRVDFVLYRVDDDHDSDGLWDSQEDARPDGVYNPAEDWASYTNADTDGDYLTDDREWGLGADPKDPDSDGDGQSDYEEADITGTGPTDSNSYMRCSGVLQAGTNVTVCWASVDGKDYWLQRSTDLAGTGDWVQVAGPVHATSGTTCVAVTNAPANAAYRVRIPYDPP